MPKTPENKTPENPTPGKLSAPRRKADRNQILARILIVVLGLVALAQIVPAVLPASWLLAIGSALSR